MKRPRDPGLDILLDLDGQTFFVDEAGHYRVKFEIRKVEVGAARPHGLRYALTLHDAEGRRLIGFDNAHPVAAGRGPGRAVPSGPRP